MIRGNLLITDHHFTGSVIVRLIVAHNAVLISHYKQIYDVSENIHAFFHHLSAVSGIFPGTIVPNGRNSVRNDFHIALSAFTA